MPMKAFDSFTILGLKLQLQLQVVKINDINPRLASNIPAHLSVRTKHTTRSCYLLLRDCL